jgi:hypothetical protein
MTGIGILKKIRFARANEASINNLITTNHNNDLTMKQDIIKNKVSTFHQTTDGSELRQIKRAIPSIAWVRSKANLLSGQEYIQFSRIRAGALPSLMRTSRGRRGPPQMLRCRAGCDVMETAAHVIQVCPRTYGGRCLRHNDYFVPCGLHRRLPLLPYGTN